MKKKLILVSLSLSALVALLLICNIFLNFNKNAQIASIYLGMNLVCLYVYADKNSKIIDNVYKIIIGAITIVILFLSIFPYKIFITGMELMAMQFLGYFITFISIIMKLIRAKKTTYL